MSNWGQTEVKPLSKNFDIASNVAREDYELEDENFLLRALGTTVQTSYKPEIRISKLPICGVLQAMEELRFSRGETETKTLGADFYTDIGTTTHEFWQTILPLSDQRDSVFGNWRCQSCKQVIYELCTTPKKLKCTSCGGPLKYDEITVQYGKGQDAVTGHIDMVRKRGKRLRIIDWKTTNAKSLIDAKYLPYPKNVMQIECYDVLLQELVEDQGLVVEGHSLVYVSRDKIDAGPSNGGAQHMLARGNLVTPKLVRLRTAQLEHAYKTKRAVRRFLEDPTPKRLKTLDDLRPCRSRVDYDRKSNGMTNAFFGREECPYVKAKGDACSCFRDVKYTRAARDLYKMTEGE